MALPNYPSPISFSQIRSGFLTTNNKLSDFFQKDVGPVFTGQVGYPFGTAASVPASGAIRMSNFSGATPYFPAARSVTISAAGAGSWTVPSTLTGNITVSAIGAGGGGAGWPGWCGGGGGGGGSRWIGRPSANTVIPYYVGYGGSRGPAGASGYGGEASTFGSSGQSWYIVAYGGGGGIASLGSERASGGSGNFGTGGAGASRYATNPATSAVNLGGGGGTNDGNSAPPGAGAGGGGSGGASVTNGNPPGGGGGGGDRGVGGNGASGGLFITGTW